MVSGKSDEDKFKIHHKLLSRVFINIVSDIRLKIKVQVDNVTECNNFEWEVEKAMNTNFKFIRSC